MRYSHQRELIENILRSRCDHPTAEEIYFSAREIEPNISLGTVYRNLKLLADSQKVLTLETVDKKIHYDGDIKPHSHFLCNECLKIYDFFIEEHIPSEILDSGFLVKEVKNVYYGKCPECQNKIKN